MATAVAASARGEREEKQAAAKKTGSPRHAHGHVVVYGTFFGPRQELHPTELHARASTQLVPV
jgi:hypothetical protein